MPAFYDVVCEGDCGEHECVMDMAEALLGHFSCPVCNGPARKVYHVPADHSANTFRAYWSDNLTKGADPVYVKTKDEYKQRMKAMGVAHYEKGMREDRDRHEAQAAAKEKTALFNEVRSQLIP